MRAYSTNELFCLTRNELFALHARIAADLPGLPEFTPDYDVALANMRLVRLALSRTAYPASLSVA
jgi:hypothetical protein